MVVVAAAAARRREGWVQPVREPCALASGVCGATRLGSGWGGTRGWVFVSGAALGGAGREPGSPAVAAGALKASDAGTAV